MLGVDLTVPTIPIANISGNASEVQPPADVCSLGIVCDDLNSLKVDVDKFMSGSSNDFAANYARFLALSSRLDGLEGNFALLQSMLNRLDSRVNRTLAIIASQF